MITRRKLLKGACMSGAVLAASRTLAVRAADEPPAEKPDVGTGPYDLPPLPYAYNALDPSIDERTMRIHHDKHHAAYVKKLNDAIAKHLAELGKEIGRRLSCVI